MAHLQAASSECPCDRGPHAVRVVAALVLLLGPSAVVHAQKETPPPPRGSVVRQFVDSEAARKFRFLVNVACFTQWPDEAFPRPDSPVIIGVFVPRPTMGHAKMPPPPPAPPAQNAQVNGPEIRVFEQGMLRGRAYMVQPVSRLEEMRNCHVLYFPPGLDHKAAGVLKMLKDRPILTIGETEQFARIGGMVELSAFQRGGPPTFEINMDAALRSGLNFSSRMLSLASRVHKDGEK